MGGPHAPPPMTDGSKTPASNRVKTRCDQILAKLVSQGVAATPFLIGMSHKF